MKLDKYSVGKRYSKALFELACETNQEQIVFDEVETLKRVVNDNPDLGLILVDPRLNLLKKREILATLKQNFSPLMQRFLQMLFEYKRMDDVSLIIDEFEKLHAIKNQMVLAHVTTAVPLSTSQHEKLAVKIAQQFDAKSAEIEVELNPKILGGVVVEVNNKVFDGSVKTQLERLKKALVG